MITCSKQGEQQNEEADERKEEYAEEACKAGQTQSRSAGEPHDKVKGESRLAFECRHSMESSSESASGTAILGV